MKLDMFSVAELQKELTARTVPPPRISFPADVLTHINQYSNKEQEHFIVINLDGAHQVISHQAVTIGLMNRTIVHPREVFRVAIQANAAAIICAHNHPSGNLEPSQEDKEITTRLRDAGELIGIPMLDHVIISKYGYYSFLEEGALT